MTKEDQLEIEYTEKIKPFMVPSFGELIDLMIEVDTKSPQAKLNENTISDNNGGRILL